MNVTPKFGWVYEGSPVRWHPFFGGMQMRPLLGGAICFRPADLTTCITDDLLRSISAPLAGSTKFVDEDDMRQLNTLIPWIKGSHRSVYNDGDGEPIIRHRKLISPYSTEVGANCTRQIAHVSVPGSMTMLGVPYFEGCYVYVPFGMPDECGNRISSLGLSEEESFGHSWDLLRGMEMIASWLMEDMIELIRVNGFSIAGRKPSSSPPAKKKRPMPPRSHAEDRKHEWMTS